MTLLTLFWSHDIWTLLLGFQLLFLHTLTLALARVIMLHSSTDASWSAFCIFVAVYLLQGVNWQRDWKGWALCYIDNPVLINPPPPGALVMSTDMLRCLTNCRLLLLLGADIDAFLAVITVKHTIKNATLSYIICHIICHTFCSAPISVFK